MESAVSTQRAAARGRPRKRRPLRKLLLALLAVLVLFPFYEMGSIYAYGLAHDDKAADAAVVLGAAEYNNRPSPVFRQRIEHAIQLYKDGRVRAIVFTGGPGKGSRFAEAEVGRDYAVRNGVKASDIFTESISKVTYGNLWEARRIAKREGFDRVLVVSDPIHMKRAVTMARDLGLDAHPSPTPTSQFRTWRTKGPFLLRETYYYSLYAIGRHFIDQANWAR